MDIQKNILQALDNIRPVLEEHGGSIKLIEITDDNTIKLQVSGQCSNCPKSGNELKKIVTKSILKMVPTVEKVEILAPPSSTFTQNQENLCQ